MANENIIKLAEALASIGFSIKSFKYLNDYNLYFRDVEITLFSDSIPLSKEKMIQLIETLASVGFIIVKYEFSSEYPPKDTQLILYIPDLKENDKEK
jgi:hypothetical protein